MLRPPRIAYRIAGALLAILFVFGAAVVFTRIGLGRIAAAEAEVVAVDRQKHAGQRIAAEIRELALHQAHVLFAVEAGGGHLDQAAQHLREAIIELRASTTFEDAPRAERIVALAGTVERVFRERGMPALSTGDRAGILAVAAELVTNVDLVVGLTDDLDRELSVRSDVAIARAAEVRGQASTITMICFAVAFAIAAIAGTLLARSIVRPVAALWAGAKRIGDGDLSSRITVSGRDELAALAGSFNQMAADLAVKQEALVRTQKLAAIGQLAAGVAHEINNPLSVILGYAKLLRRAAGAKDQDELQAIEDEARQCQRIVQELLELARPAQLAFAQVDLVELIRSEVARLDDAGVLEGRTVAPPASTPVVVVADEGRVRQVVANLVINAAHASPPGECVTIEVSSSDHVVVAVRDRGAGIAPDLMPRVFEPFFTTKPRGTGLGLAIAQALADAHGGRIELESQPGSGTCARLVLPKRSEET